MTGGFEALKIVVGRRWPLIALLFAFELAVILSVSNAQFFPSEESVYRAQYNYVSTVLNASAAGQVYGIFTNNFRVAIAELIPIGGLGIFSLSLYQTARIVEVIGLVQGVGVGLALANLFFLPSTWLELPAYAIAATESIYVTVAVGSDVRSGQWRKIPREITFILVNVALIAGVLIVAAVFEVAEIQLESANASASATSLSQVLPLLTWLPFLLVLGGVIVFWRRARREAPNPAMAESEGEGGGGPPTPP